MSELPTLVTGQLVAPAPREALLLLKREGTLSLMDLSRRLRISKMGAHKHLTNLEQRGLVERFYEHRGVGRPRLWFRLTDESNVLFPKAYSDISRTALSFIDRKLGRNAVEQVLKERQNELYARYSGKLEGKEGLERVKELARLRDQDGYMAEARQAGKLSLEMLEHNCPILEIASEFPEACFTETQLFTRLLGTKVEATHRAAVGDHVCRFMIQAKQIPSPRR